MFTRHNQNASRWSQGHANAANDGKVELGIIVSVLKIRNRRAFLASRTPHELRFATHLLSGRSVPSNAAKTTRLRTGTGLARRDTNRISSRMALVWCLEKELVPTETKGLLRILRSSQMDFHRALCSSWRSLCQSLLLPWGDQSQVECEQRGAWDCPHTRECTFQCSPNQQGVCLMCCLHGPI